MSVNGDMCRLPDAVRGTAFRRVLAARTISALGSAAAPIAIAFGILDATGRASALSLVLAVQVSTQILVLPLAGVVADRWGRRTTMVVGDLAGTAGQTLVAVLLASGIPDLVALCASVALSASGSALFQPAANALVTDIVKPAKFRQATALLRLSRSSTAVFGATAGGLAVATLGSAPTLFVDGATFAVSGAILVLTEVPYSPTCRRPYAGQIRQGWKFTWHTPWIAAVIVQFTVVNATLVGVLEIVGPVVTRAEPGGPASWGVILASWAVGMVLGGLLPLRWSPERSLRVGVGGVILVTPFLCAVGAGGNLLLCVATAAVGGAALEHFAVVWQTALQQHVPPHLLARVSAFDSLSSYAGIPIGYLAAGELVTGLGPRCTVVVGALSILGATTGALLCRPVHQLIATSPSAAQHTF